MKYALLFFVGIVVAGIAYLAFSPMDIETTRVEKTIPTERFFDAS